MSQRVREEHSRRSSHIPFSLNALEGVVPRERIIVSLTGGPRIQGVRVGQGLIWYGRWYGRCRYATPALGLCQPGTRPSRSAPATRPGEYQKRPLPSGLEVLV